MVTLTLHTSKGRASTDSVLWTSLLLLSQPGISPPGTSAPFSSGRKESPVSWVTGTAGSLAGLEEQGQHLSHTVCQLLAPGWPPGCSVDTSSLSLLHMKDPVPNSSYAGGMAWGSAYNTAGQQDS